MNVHRGRLHPLPPSPLSAPGRSRQDFLLGLDAGISTSLAKPLWTGCKSSASDEISAQSKPDGPTTAPLSRPLDINLLEAFRQPPEVTATAAPKLEIWPKDGHRATKFDPTVPYKFFNRENELKYMKELVSSSPENVILLLGPRSCGKTVSSFFLLFFPLFLWYFLIVFGLCAGVD